MGRELILEEIREGGNVQIAQLSSGEVRIGRAVGDGVLLDNSAVSSEHGCFLRVRNHWFYKDLGSTNGSWINGKTVGPDAWQLLRANDTLQLANTPLKILEGVGTGTHGSPGTMGGVAARSLIVFSKGEFVDEFPVPEYGRALVVGGSQADLTLLGDISELPSLVIERRGEGVVGFQVGRTYPVFVNGEKMEDSVALGDRDELKIEVFFILYNDPPRSADTPPVPDWGERQAASSESWGRMQPMTEAPRERHASKSLFGRSGDSGVDDMDQTVAMDSMELEARLGSKSDMHPSMRYTTEEFTSDGSLRSIEEKIVIVLAFLMLLALLLLVVWWVFA